MDRHGMDSRASLNKHTTTDPDRVDCHCDALLGAGTSPVAPLRALHVVAAGPAPAWTGARRRRPSARVQHRRASAACAARATGSDGRVSQRACKSLGVGARLGMMRARTSNRSRSCDWRKCAACAPTSQDGTRGSRDSATAIASASASAAVGADASRGGRGACAGRCSSSRFGYGRRAASLAPSCSPSRPLRAVSPRTGRVGSR